jgi:predicted enzyme related to lactoylglutathione lyase
MDPSGSADDSEVGKRHHQMVIKVDVLFASMPVKQLDSAVAWYSQLLGCPPAIVPNEDEVMWRITDGAWLYVIRDEHRAGRSVVTLCVSDLNGSLAEISGRGITSGAIEMIGDSGRKAAISEADGNIISFTEVNAPH